MNRNEAINQLNLERKRKENRVWEEWFLTESQNNVTSGRLLDRTNKLSVIRDEYDKDLQRINNTPIEEVETKSPQKQVANNTQPRRTVSLGTENLPKNQPLIPGQEVRPRSQPTQVDNKNEPQVVRQAREENERAEKEEQDASEDSSSQENNQTPTPEQKNTGTKKSNRKLNDIECFVLIIIGIFADLLNLIPIINILVNLIVAPSLGIYFRMKKIFLGPTIIAGVIEFIPVLSVIPGTTLGIIFTIFYDRFGKKVLKNVPVVSTIVHK